MSISQKVVIVAPSHAAGLAFVKKARLVAVTENVKNRPVIVISTTSLEGITESIIYVLPGISMNLRFELVKVGESNTVIQVAEYR